MNWYSLWFSKLSKFSSSDHKDFSESNAKISKCDKYLQVWQISPSVTNISKCDKYLQVWQISPSVTNISKCDISPSVTNISKCDKYLQVWQISPSVTNISKCDKYLQVWQISPSVTNQSVTNQSVYGSAADILNCRRYWCAANIGANQTSIYLHNEQDLCLIKKKSFHTIINHFQSVFTSFHYTPGFSQTWGEVAIIIDTGGAKLQ